MARFLESYRDTIRPKLMAERGYRNIHAVPTLEKILVNVGIGEAVTNDAIVEHTVRDVSVMTGQRPVVTRARKSVAAFRLRKGQRIGVKATLRGRRMYEFLDRLLTLAIPRVRDFRGLSLSAFDGRGNYSLGLTEQLVFPEIDYDQVREIRGFQITIVTTAKTDSEARRLLELFRFPFERAEAA
jgi:large subunit ribosomal protein L5